MNERVPNLNVDEYKNAPSGVGPQAVTWKDKPHRLIYDLCAEVEELRRELRNDSERLRIILSHRGIMEHHVREHYQTQARRVQDEIDAMVEVLGFKIDWSHDSRQLEDIITDELGLLVVRQDTKRVDCHTILLEKVKLLRRIEQRELDFYNAIHDTEIKKYD